MEGLSKPRLKGKGLEGIISQPGQRNLDLKGRLCCCRVRYHYRYTITVTMQLPLPLPQLRYFKGNVTTFNFIFDSLELLCHNYSIKYSYDKGDSNE